MPAADRLGRLVLGLGLGLAIVGCASRSPSTLAASEATQWAEPSPPAEPADGAAGGDADADAQTEEKRDEDDGDLDLAAYERLLVDQELRLRSAGVEVAMGELQVASRDGGGDAVPVPEKSPGGGGSGRSDTSLAGGVTTPSSTPTRPTTKPSTSQSSGVTTKTKSAKKATRATPKSAADSRGQESEGDACLNVCDLAAATCDLEQRICDLASRHASEPRYQQVCARAQDDCRIATRACETCAV